MKRLFYFGKIRVPGHYWFKEGEVSMPYAEKPAFAIDMEHTPEKDLDQGSAREVVLEDCLIVAWHDYTGDSRPNSNSALVGFEYHSREDMLEDAKTMFPSVMARQPGPLVFVEEKK